MSHPTPANRDPRPPLSRRTQALFLAGMATVMAVVVGVSVLRGDALWWAPVAAIALGYGLAVTVWLLGVWQVGYASVKGAAALLIGLVIAAVLGLGIAGLTA